MSDIAIVGGGAAGAAVFGELLAREAGADVHWVVGHHVPGRGATYATTDDRHLLNVRAAGLGLFADQNDAFLRHAERQRGCVSGRDFLPRRLFGDFVEAQVRARMEAARRRGRRFAVHADHAVRIEAEGQDIQRLRLASGEALEVATVVLATGAQAPRPLGAVTAEARASGAYQLDPWRLAEHRGNPSRVVVIGTGLMAVDALLSASALWPQAELVAVSRRGRLPFAHAPTPLAPYPYQSDLNESLLACHGPRAMLRQFRQALEELPQVDWRSVIDGLRPINAELWCGLDVAQRRQFMRHVRWIWGASRHRTAPASHETMAALQSSGRLQVHAARVLVVDGEGPLEVTMRHRASHRMETVRADLVVQATGLGTAVDYTGDPLLSGLLADGLATPDPLQLGLSARTDGQLLNARCEPQQGLYAIGSLLRGNTWESAAMPEIRHAARDLAIRLSVGQGPCEWRQGLEQERWG